MESQIISNVNLAAIVAAAAGGISVGGLLGVLLAWRHWRARLELIGRTVAPNARPAASRSPSLWRDGWDGR